MLVTNHNYERCVSAINQHSEIVVDTETTGLDWVHGDRVCGVCIVAGDESYYFPFRHEPGGNLELSKLSDLCHRVLRPDRPQLGFNYAFDIRMLAQEEGFIIPEVWEDSQLSAHLLNENDRMKMEFLATKYLHADAGDEEDALLDAIVERFGGSKKSAKGKLWRMAPHEVAPYGEQDVITTRELRDFHRPHLETWKISELYREVCEYARAIVNMEMNGLLLDVPLIHQYMAEAEAISQELEERAAVMAGYGINLRSSKQLQAWLGLKSTAKEHLKPMSEQGDERAKLILDYRVWSKAVGTYYKPYLRFMGEDRVLHPNLNPTGTVIRLSCRDPNMQAVPRGTNEYKIKDVFKAREGYDIIEADLSQAEVRVMCHYTQDPKLKEIVLNGLNMHDMVSQEQNLPRDVAKRLNFSAQYGIGANSFSKTYGYPLKDSRAYLKKYHGMFPGMRRLYNRADEKAQRQGFIRLYTGRPQHFDKARSPSHKASSRLIQGAVAEMMRIACVRMRKELPDVVQLLQVHDSFVLETPKPLTQQLIPEIKRIMEDQPWCTIPTKADVKVGSSWGTAEEWKA